MRVKGMDETRGNKMIVEIGDLINNDENDDKLPSQCQSRLAIIIPVYNTEQYVKEMVQNLIDQTFTSFSVFAVNDGSKDGSLGILKQIATTESRIHVISQPNGGPGKARNTGLDFIQKNNLEFDYIWFCDSDDKVSPDVLSKVVAALDRTQSDYGLFSVRRFDKKEVKTYKAHVTSEELLDHEAIVRQYFRFGWKWRKEPCSEAFLNNKIFRFNVVKDLRFREDIRRAEDFDYFFRLLPRLQHCVLVPDAFYSYRLRKSSLTNAYDNTGDLTVCTEHYAELSNRTHTEQVAMQHRLIRAFYLDICQALNQNDSVAYTNLLTRYTQMKLRYGLKFTDIKIVMLLGPLVRLLPTFNQFRNQMKTIRDRSNFYE